MFSELWTLKWSQSHRNMYACIWSGARRKFYPSKFWNISVMKQKINLSGIQTVPLRTTGAPGGVAESRSGLGLGQGEPMASFKGTGRMTFWNQFQRAQEPVWRSSHWLQTDSIGSRWCQPSLLTPSFPYPVPPRAHRCLYVPLTPAHLSLPHLCSLLCSFFPPRNSSWIRIGSDSYLSWIPQFPGEMLLVLRARWTCFELGSWNDTGSTTG